MRNGICEGSLGACWSSMVIVWKGPTDYLQGPGSKQTGHVDSHLIDNLNTRVSELYFLFTLLQSWTNIDPAFRIPFLPGWASRPKSRLEQESHWGFIPVVGCSHFSLLCQKISAPGGGRPVPFFAKRPPLTYAVLCSSASAVERIALLSLS